MSQIKAMALEVTTSQVSDGTDTPIAFTSHDALKDGLGWVDVRAFSRLSVVVDAAGAAGCSFTVEGKLSATSAAVDIYAKAAAVTGTLIVDRHDIMGVAYVRVLEDGTATQTQTVSILAK